MRIIISYIKFLWKSTNQHGVHSPFVYDLVTKCFYDRKKYPSFSIIKKYRRRLFHNNRTIKVTDYGVGSRVFSSDQRRISDIAKNAGISFKRSRILNKMVPFLKIKKALELGTSVGMGTAAIAAGNNANVTTLEGCEKTAAVAQESFDFFNLKNIDLRVGNFDDLIPIVAEEKWDLIYFDGNHNKEATLKYFEKLLPTVENDPVFIFDDIHWSVSMEEAWEEIKNNEKVTVTIDTFFWGIVFFRKEQAKEHFIIRL